jgi:hypothetical protein
MVSITLLGLFACTTVVVSAFSPFTAEPESTSTASSKSTLLRNIRSVLSASQAVAAGLQDVLPAMDEHAADAYHNLVHAPGRVLLTGTTARGTRDTFTRSARQSEKGHEQHSAEHLAADHLAKMVDGVASWFGSDEGASSQQTAADSKPSWARGHTRDEIDTLSRLHLRAAGAAAAQRRRDSSRQFSAQSHAVDEEDSTADGSHSSRPYLDVYGDPEEVRRAQARSEQRLVRLLRWRRLQRGHNDAPRIPAAFLPHYAKDFSGHEESRRHRQQREATAARRGFSAQQTDFERPVYRYCHDGVPVYPSSVNFTCVNRFGAPQNFTAVQVAAQPPAVRMTCQPLQNRRACVCPRDSFAGRTVFGDVVCFWKELECNVTRLAPADCAAPPIDQPMRVPRCIIVSRSSTLDLSVNVTCRWFWVNPTDYAFYGIEVLPEPNEDEDFLLLNVTNRTQPIVSDVSQLPRAPYGTYADISDVAFMYPVEPAGSPIPLTAVHPVVGAVAFYARPINFNRPSSRIYQQMLHVGKEGYVPGMLTGAVPATFTMDIANISSAFVHGNRMFIEVGLRGGDGASIRPEGVISAPFTIDFTDLPVPPLRGQSSTNTVAIAVGVSVGVAVLIAIIVAVVCVVRRRRQAAMHDKQD